MGLFEYELPSAARYAQAVHTPEHVRLARRIAEESIVLLKNEGRVLPLRVDELHDLALVGPNADQVQFGDYTWSRDNKDGVTLRAALERRLQGKVRLHYARGCDLVTADRSGIAAVVEAARRSDVCVVVVGSASASLARDYSNATCGEGFDLSDLRLTGVQDGMEVPQVYVRDVHASVVTPVHELKAFRKVMIRKGETATVRLSIPVAELALYDRNMKKVVEPGAFELQIGRASDDIRIKKVITVERHKETHIPTLADRKRKTAPAPVLVTAVKVRGVVRDVQANPLPDVAVSVGNRRVTTDAKGNYAVSALSTDTLIIGGGRYKEERIPIEGRQVIHVRLQNL